MVLGLRSKNKKNSSVHVDYIIHIQEIKPWPPSQSLKSLRSVVLHWENGDRNSGTTSIVTPNLGSSAAEGKIEFNESFKLEVTFLKEGSSKGNDKGAFQKNLLEFNLYEPRRDKSKGQHLGSALIDLAEHGIVKNTVNTSIPVNSKRSFRNTALPMLYVKIHPVDNGSVGSSSRESLSKEVSLDKDGKESVSDLMTEEYAEEAEIASFTDDDVSSHSSLDNLSSAVAANAAHSTCDVEENVPETVKKNGGGCDDESNSSLASGPPKVESQVTNASHMMDVADQNGILPESLSVCSLSNTKSLEEINVDPKSPRESSMPAIEKSDNPSMTSSPLLIHEAAEKDVSSSRTEEVGERNPLIQEVEEKLIDCGGREDILEDHPHKEDTSDITDIVESSNSAFQTKQSNMSEDEQNLEQDGKLQESRNNSEEAANNDGAGFMFKETEIELPVRAKVVENSLSGNQNVIDALQGPIITTVASLEQNSVTEQHSFKQNNGKVVENHLSGNQNVTDALEGPIITTLASSEQNSVTQQHNFKQNNGTISTDLAISSRRSLGEKLSGTFTSERMRTMRLSVRSPPHLIGSIPYKEDVKEIDIQEDICDTSTNSSTDDGRDDNESTSSGSSKVKHVSRVNGRGFSSNKVHELELRVKLLEAELREAAAIEIGLYSIVAEHGSSAHKVHTPARRLSRLYNHASRQWSTERRASAARSIVSGLALAAKACGNDVSRLTFWLSNSILLRAIVTETTKYPDIRKSSSMHFTNNGSLKLPKTKSSPLKWESISRKNEKFSLSEEFGDWEDPDTFVSALEKIETWMFSRTVESVWWQTLAPCMQSGTEGSEQQLGSYSAKNYARTPSMGDQQQANFSVEIWNKAFKDASERLCPLRSEGLECGCLPMLVRLVMEQCVARLDVAMFNAILRKSDDEIPTDPVSDPIGDPKVLPTPTGELSFGSGAQLKNAVGNWSRWLTDLFGMDIDEDPTNETNQDDRISIAASFKSFHLLNALSDLLMLPKDMLLEESIRKEVCPAFSSSMIKHVLDIFLPDEFCPEPIPNAVLEALESEEYLESNQEEIRNIPCNASPIIYCPPSVTSIKNIVGEIRSTSLLRRSGSSVIRKCHTSDDELEELDSPLASIIIDKSPTPKFETKGNGNSCAIRYQLLREVWKGDN
ncbi:hypothetical protein Cni_G23123 [Canna indica]|uniref:C2 NT-type domain-containing protein n=1 Tax=Canna indica TaxID=4628 RepID=A0AAQ3KSU1_9LILI|nr:hypothetical protein Cni_G23123 [Canna indica]